MSSPPRGYAQSIEIAVPPAQAWRAFTDEAWLGRWYGEAHVEPRVGGAFRVRTRDGRLRDATIDVWDEGRRLRLIYFPEPELVARAPGASPVVEDVLFDPKPGCTVVRVLGSGVPAVRGCDAWFTRLRTGWTYALAELKRVLEADPAREAS